MEIIRAAKEKGERWVGGGGGEEKNRRQSLDK